MPTEITSNNDLDESTEKQSLSFTRFPIEERISDQERILGMDFPSGILVSD